LSGSAWKQFLAAQARGIIAAGFVHVDAVLLRRIYCPGARRTKKMS
jgi:hypothetical protein